jgi:hypothetical protein
MILYSPMITDYNVIPIFFMLDTGLTKIVISIDQKIKPPIFIRGLTNPPN